MINRDPLPPSAELIMHILHAAGGRLPKEELKNRYCAECIKYGTPEKALAAWKANEVVQ